MFSAFTAAQNKVSSIPITAVTFSIGSNTNSTYTGSAQSVTVVSTTPPGATYSTSATTATNAGGVASTTITGTGIYTGSFTSPNLTIIAATISGTVASPSANYNAGSQSGTVITGVTAGATFSGSVTASGTNAGSYTSSITGTGNYQGTVLGGNFTINRLSITGTPTSPSTSYNAAQQTQTVITGVTAGATFTGSTTVSGTNAGTYTSSITGNGNYQGTVNGGNFTINKVGLSVSGFQVNACLGFSVARMQFSVSGFQGGDTGSLATWIGIGSPAGFAPVSTNDMFASNAVSQSTNENPIGIGNGFNNSSLYLCSNIDGYQYWVQVTGNATNYNASGFDGPVDQQCGS
jgi:hypothetical protein